MAALASWMAKPNFYSLPSTEKEINIQTNHKDRSLTSIANVLSPPDWFEKASRDLHAVCSEAHLNRIRWFARRRCCKAFSGRQRTSEIDPLFQECII